MFAFYGNCIHRMRYTEYLSTGLMFSSGGESRNLIRAMSNIAANFGQTFMSNLQQSFSKFEIQSLLKQALSNLLQAFMLSGLVIGFGHSCEICAPTHLYPNHIKRKKIALQHNFLHNYNLYHGQTILGIKLTLISFVLATCTFPLYFLTFLKKQVLANCKILGVC